MKNDSNRLHAGRSIGHGPIKRDKAEIVSHRHILSFLRTVKAGNFIPVLASTIIENDATY
jgi:hypothetical protein